jgi:hypothetical protein
MQQIFFPYLPKVSRRFVALKPRPVWLRLAVKKPRQDIGVDLAASWYVLFAL